MRGRTFSFPIIKSAAVSFYGGRKASKRWKWRWRSPAKYCRSATSTWRRSTICCEWARLRPRKSSPKCWLSRKKLSPNPTSENLSLKFFSILLLSVRSGLYCAAVSSEISVSIWFTHLFFFCCWSLEIFGFGVYYDLGALRFAIYESN